MSCYQQPEDLVAPFACCARTCSDGTSRTTTVATELLVLRTGTMVEDVEALCRWPFRNRAVRDTGLCTGPRREAWYAKCTSYTPTLPPTPPVTTLHALQPSFVCRVQMTAPCWFERPARSTRRTYLAVVWTQRAGVRHTGEGRVSWGVCVCVEAVRVCPLFEGHLCEHKQTHMT